MERRYERMNDPRWVDGMVILISDLAYFRWFDSGDIQGVKHLDNIVEVCKRTQQTKHWLPTKEWDIVDRWIETRGDFPNNLTVRRSMHMIDMFPIEDGIWSSVSTDNSKVTCPSSLNGLSCKENQCRKCWDKNAYNITYKEH